MVSIHCECLQLNAAELCSTISLLQCCVGGHSLSVAVTPTKREAQITTHTEGVTLFSDENVITPLHLYIANSCLLLY